MAKKIINVNAPDDFINTGSAPNARDGDSLRSSFARLNEAINDIDTNFTDLYTSLGLISDTNINIGAFEFIGSTLSTTDSSSIIVDQATTITSNLTVGGDILPSRNLTSTLGNSTHRFHSIYVGTGSVYIGDAKLSLENGTLNSSVGFAAGSLNIGGVNVTVNEDGALYSDGGFVGASVGTIDWSNITAKPTIISNLDTNGIIGFTNAETITEETVGGTVSQTTTQTSQVAIDDTSVVITRKVNQTVDDGVVTTTDEQGAELVVGNDGIWMNYYAEPAGPNNTTYFKVGTDAGAYLEGKQEDIGGYTLGRVQAGAGTVIVTTHSIDDKEWIFDQQGILTLPSNSYLETTDVNLKVGAQGEVVIRSHAEYSSTTRSWTFNTSGTLETPLMLPTTFTAVLDTDHMVDPTALADTPWQFEIQFQVDPNGGVVTYLNNPFPNPVNPGYASGKVFRFVEVDHGIPGYTFDITLTDVVEAGPAGWTANPAVTQPPEYPSTLSSLGAIKLTSNGNDLIFGTNGVITLPNSGTIVSQENQVYISKAGVGSTGEVIAQVDNAGLQATSTADGDIRSGAVIATLGRLDLTAANENLVTLETDYTEARIILEDTFTAFSAEAGYPWGITLPVSNITYDELINQNSGTIPSQVLQPLPPLALNAKNTYNAWQTQLTATNITLSVNSHNWILDAGGNLNLPTYGNRPQDIKTGIKFGNGTLQTTAFNLDQYSNLSITNFVAAGGFTNYSGAVYVRASRPSDSTVDFVFRENGQFQLPAGGDIVDINGTSVLGSGTYDQGLNTTDNVQFAQIWCPGDFRQNTAITVTPTSVNVPGATPTVVFSADSWMTSIKLVIAVEGRLDGDGTNVDHTQTCEATIAATYNTAAEPIMSVYGIVYTSPTPLATFTVARNLLSGNIEITAANSQTTNALNVRVQALQFVSYYD